MPTKLFLKFTILLLAGTTFLSAKDTEKKGEGEKDLKSEIKEYIRHHLEDTHDLGLYSFTDDEKGKKIYRGLPLPVILWDEGLKVFSSTQLNHGKSVAQAGDNYYKLYHGKIYKTDEKGTISYDDHDHPIITITIAMTITIDQK